MDSPQRAARALVARVRRRDSPEHRALAKHFASGGAPVVLTDANDMRFVLYPWEIDGLDELLSKDFYRPDFEAIARLLGPGQTAVDVGANVGTHSIMMSRRVGPAGRVVAFEPVPATAWLMRENLVLNRVENVELACAAVSDAAGTIEMNLFDQRYSAWNSRGRPSFDGIVPVQTVQVPAVNLDAAMRERGIEQIDYLKIDVEGFEIDVLTGARELLSAGAVICLSFEVSAVPLGASGHTAEEVFELLAALGYRCYALDPTRGGFVGPVEGSNDFYANFYASRADLTGR